MKISKVYKIAVIVFAVLICSVTPHVWGDCVDYFDYGDNCQSILRLNSPGTSWQSSNLRFVSGDKWGDLALSAPDNGTGGVGDLYYYDGDDGKLRFIIKNDGKIGIGTATPVEQLDVNGSISVKKANWEGIYFGDKATLIWRPYGGGTPAINSNSLVLGTDDFIAEIYLDTIWDGVWAYCEGTTTAGAGVDCADYDGALTSNDNFWVWKNGHSATPESKKDLKFLFDGESNDGVMGYMEDEDAFYFNEKVGIGTSNPQSTLQVNGYVQLALTSGAPPTEDCDENAERGRMKVNSGAELLYICVDSGWVSK